MAQAATLNASIFSDNSQFAFDDDPTNIEFPEEEHCNVNQTVTNNSKLHKSVHKLSHSLISKSSINEETDVRKTHYISSNKLVDTNNTLQNITKDIQINGFENSIIVRGLESARVYVQLSELPWHAEFRTMGTTTKRGNSASSSKRHHSSKVESIEHQRAGSGPQYPGSGEPIVNGSSRKPSRKLADDVERPLRQDSFSVNKKAPRCQKESRPTSAPITEGEDEVFYEKDNPHDTKYCSYANRHSNDPHGVRKLGVSSYTDLYQQEHYRSDHIDINKSIQRVKDWAKYGHRLRRQYEKYRQAEYEALERQDIVDFCMRKHQPSICSLRTVQQTCPVAPSCTVDVAAELNDPTSPAIKRRSFVRSHPRCSAPAAAAERKPFMAVSSNNHVTFSMPATQQTLMNMVKNNYPTLTSMMRGLFLKHKGECLIAEFKKDMNNRMKLLCQRLTRIERSLVNATGERREKLKRDFSNTNRDLRIHEYLLEKLKHEMDDHCNSTDDERLDSPATRHPVGQRPQHDPRELNAMRVLQRVFGGAN